MPIYINSDERTALTAIGTDANEINLSGIKDSSDTAFANAVFPIADYTDSIPQTPNDRLDKAKEGSSGYLSIVYRRVSPISGSDVSLATPVTLTTSASGTQIHSYTHAQPLYVVRKVVVSVNFTCFASVGGKILEFWVESWNGSAYVETSHAKVPLPRPSEFHSSVSFTAPDGPLTHSTATEAVHHNASQSWSVTLPAVTYPGTNLAIKLMARDSLGGAGTVELGSYDTVGLSITG